jgi:hypothetical protein
MLEEKHPHLIAKETFERIADDEKFSEEERAKARLHVMVLDGIIGLATRITTTYPDICYMTACDLIDEFLFDPMQEQS